MTHRSGLQYSYDDLDLVCCHGVDSEGPWIGTGGSKQGRRARCASMPECCHQPPTHDLAQALEVTASVADNGTESEHLKIVDSNGSGTMNFHEEFVDGSHEVLDVDIPQSSSDSEYPETTDIIASGEFNSNSRMTDAHITCSFDSSSQNGKTVNSEGEVGTEGRQNHNISDDDNVFKSPHISGEEQQCISICSDNGPPLSDSASEQSGKLPNPQETMESHTEDYCRPPEPSEATLTQSSSAELEPQADLPDVEKDKVSTTDLADKNVTLPAGVMDYSVNGMENGEVISNANQAVELTFTPVVEGECNKEGTECKNRSAAVKLDGTDEPKTLNENNGPTPHTQDIQGCSRPVRHDCEISSQTEQHNVEMAVLKQAQGEEGGQAEVNKKATEVSCGARSSSDISIKGQSCSMKINNDMSSEQLDVGYSKVPQVQMLTNTIPSTGQAILMETSLNQPTENVDGSTVSKDLIAEVQPSACQVQVENGFTKLDTILEVSLAEADEKPVLQTQTNIALNFARNPEVLLSNMPHEKTAAKQHTQSQPTCSAEISDELSPEGLHSNQAPGCYFSESPASEVADGQREHHRLGATFARVEEMDETPQTVIYSDTHLASPVLVGLSELEDQKQDNMAKMRTKKVRLSI